MPTRIGATTSSRGSSACTATSKRTWSLPLPVQPWATASARSRFATSTSSCAISGPRERGGQGIDALVLGVGLEAGPDELADETVARVHDVRARGARAHGAIGDALAQRAAADVDGERHDLDVVLLAQPGDGHGGIEPARIGEDDLLQRALQWPRNAPWSDAGRSCLRAPAPSFHDGERGALDQIERPSAGSSTPGDDGAVAALGPALTCVATASIA